MWPTHRKYLKSRWQKLPVKGSGTEFNKVSKAAIINMCKELKEVVLEKIEESTMTMSHQIENH